MAEELNQGDKETSQDSKDVSEQRRQEGLKLRYDLYDDWEIRLRGLASVRP